MQLSCIFYVLLTFGPENYEISYRRSVGLNLRALRIKQARDLHIWVPGEAQGQLIYQRLLKEYPGGLI